MSGAFDPYHRWLGIPPKDQPANHYRMLGIELFEGDPEVIRDAAERQMAHVRTYQLGEHVQLSQRILNELGAAKACLLDAGKKVAYDAALRRPPQPKAKAAVSPDDVYALAPTSLPVRLPEPPRRPKPVPSHDVADKPAAPPRRPSTALGSRLLQVGGAAAALALLVGLLLSVDRLWNSAERLGQQPTSRRPSEPSEATQPSEPSQPSLPSQAVVESHPPKPLDVPPSRPPKLARIVDQTIEEGTMLQIKVRCDDLGTCGGRLRFGLAAGAPSGAAIHPLNGVFTWMPGRDQAPGEYPVTVRVLADGSENLSDQTTFHVVVRKVNNPPVLYAIRQRRVVVGQKVQFTVGATNPGRSLDEVAFSLPKAPSWVSIDPASGMVTCEPDETLSPGCYPVTVRVFNKAMEELQDEKTFVVVVTAGYVRVTPPGNTLGRNMVSIPSGKKFGHNYNKPGFGYSAARTQPFEIKLPSGKVLASMTVDVRDTVGREIETLLSQCRVNSPNAIGFYQDGSNATVAALASVKGNKLQGPTVIFHSCARYDSPMPKQYVNYHNGRWDGVLATWNVQGQKEFWGNYAGGQRQGLCCLFNDDALAAVLECTRNKIDAVHLIAANQLNKSFTDADEALADEAAGPLLKQVEKIAKDLKEEDRAFRERVRKGIQSKIGAVNAEKRDAFGNRAAGRANAREQQIRGMQKAGGW